jgi:hypothetical protein
VAGVFAPAKTPSQTVSKLAGWFTAAVQSPETKTKLAVQYLYPTVSCGRISAPFSAGDMTKCAAPFARRTSKQSRKTPIDILPQRSPESLAQGMVTVVRSTGFIEPCIPTRAYRVPSGPGWVHEIKHGSRFANCGLRLSRHGPEESLLTPCLPAKRHIYRTKVSNAPRRFEVEAGGVFNFDNALLALSFYRDGCDWTSGKIAMRSPRTEPSQSSLAT